MRRWFTVCRNPHAPRRRRGRARPARRRRALNWESMRLLVIGLLAALAAAQAADTSLAQPKELVAQIQAKGPQPALIHVGFAVLYRGKHIPNSVYAGPANTPAGLQALRAAVASLPRDREIVVYCGCCPWDHCPNIKPAMEALKQMGFTRGESALHPHQPGGRLVRPRIPRGAGRSGQTGEVDRVALPGRRPWSGAAPPSREPFRATAHVGAGAHETAFHGRPRLSPWRRCASGCQVRHCIQGTYQSPAPPWKSTAGGRTGPECRARSKDRPAPP